MAFRRLTVGQTLWFGFGLLLAMLAILASVSYSYLGISRASSTRLADESVVRAQIASDMERALAGAQDSLRVYHLTNRPGSYEQGFARLKDFQGDLARAEDLVGKGLVPPGFAESVGGTRPPCPSFPVRSGSASCLARPDRVQLREYGRRLRKTDFGPGPVRRGQRQRLPAGPRSHATGVDNPR